MQLQELRDNDLLVVFWFIDGCRLFCIVILFINSEECMIGTFIQIFVKIAEDFCSASGKLVFAITKHCCYNSSSGKMDIAIMVIMDHNGP